MRGGGRTYLCGDIKLGDWGGIVWLGQRAPVCGLALMAKPMLWSPDAMDICGRLEGSLSTLARYRIGFPSWALGKQG